MNLVYSRTCSNPRMTMWLEVGWQSQGLVRERSAGAQKSVWGTCSSDDAILTEESTSRDESPSWERLGAMMAIKLPGRSERVAQIEVKYYVLC